MRIRGGSVITDVGIDMDGVIYDFAKVFHAYAQTKMGKELPLPTTWDFYKEWGLTDQQFDEWLVEGVQKAQLFNCDAPMDNTVEGWNLLKENDIKIHLLTHRGSVSYEQTIHWLERFGFYPDSLHFGTNKGILKAFATDDQALKVAKYAVSQGFDRQILPVQRWFIYLPFEHSENLADQEKSVELMQQLSDDPDSQSSINYAIRHWEIIKQFGRFPHRNTILGRESTPEEEEFLQLPGSSF
jgi:uncharacterized protein (DUF924 family)